MWQFVKFNLVGLANTALDFVMFSLLSWLGFYYILAQCLSYSIGVLNSFALNKYWTFAQRGGLQPSQAARFTLLNVITLLISLFLLSIFKDQLLLTTIYAKILTTVATMLINFAGNKFWVFKVRSTNYL